MTIGALVLGVLVVYGVIWLLWCAFGLCFVGAVMVCLFIRECFDRIKTAIRNRYEIE